MADQPLTAGPGTSRRQLRQHRFSQAQDLHGSGTEAADPAWPDHNVRDGWEAAPSADVDGWSVTLEDHDRSLENSLWTSDRYTSEQLRPARPSREAATSCHQKAICVLRDNTVSEEEDYPICLLCCEPFKVVAFGKCSHKEICAECIMHMVMLYRNSKCPLCKAELDQIVVTPWAGPNTGSWSDWSSALHTLWHDHWWSEHFYVAHTAFPGTNQPLHAHFQQLTATACGVCDDQANHPFQSDSALCKHMIRQHHRHLCRLCLKARQRAFPLQQPTYTAPELHAHMVAEHPQCRFCRTRFLGEEQYGLHLMEAHPYCELCDDDFRDEAEFTEHLRSKHWLCQEPACRGCFVAYESKEDLIEHQRTVHALVNPQPNRGEEQIMAVRPVAHDVSPEGHTFGSQAWLAALLTASLRAQLGSSTAQLQPNPQRSEPSHRSSAPVSHPHLPTSIVPPMPPQQQPTADELGTSFTVTVGHLTLGRGESASRTMDFTPNGVDNAVARLFRAVQPQRLAAASSQLGPAASPQRAIAARANDGDQRTRPLSQAEIDERIASRRVARHVHRGGSLAAQPQRRGDAQQAQPEHTSPDQAGQRDKLQPGQPQDRTFLAVLNRPFASERRVYSHLAPTVRGSSQGPEAGPCEPQGSELESTDDAQQAQPEHTGPDQAGQRDMLQPGQPRNMTFLAVLNRSIASEPRVYSHLAPAVKASSQGPEPGDPQVSQLEITGPADFSSPATGWD